MIIQCLVWIRAGFGVTGVDGGAKEGIVAGGRARLRHDRGSVAARGCSGRVATAVGGRDSAREHHSEDETTNFRYENA